MCSTSTRSTEVQYYYIMQKYKYFASGRIATATMKSAPRLAYCSICTMWILRDVDLKNPVWVKDIAYSILYRG